MRISDWSSDVCSSDLENRTQPGFLAVATEQPYGAGKMFASSQRRLETQLELIGFQVSRNQIFDRPTDEVLALVMHFVEKILIGRLHPPVGIQREGQHLAVQALFPLHKADRKSVV